MAKSVLELAVGTGQWDAGLKKAKNALDNFTQANGGLQSALNKDSASMQKFVQMMGQMDSTAKTAKGQMNDYKSTIEQLTMQYNRMTDAQKAAVGQTYLQAIDQMKQKYQGVANEVAKINQSLKTMPEPAAATKGGGLFGGGKLDGMLQVFGGNLMTKGAGMLAGLASEMGDMVEQGIELAQQGEGIRIAFERLGRGDILDGLREATHGTVTDLELMKAAVKFSDFKLPLEELGTMLAFAQQKAKDTGQSVDYMVDSIVTGLGRKSLMILDNLGLSATEIRDKMKETGDMTKAVGAIIREQMQKAGDYVETAADRATRANVALQNKMEELGRKFLPVKQASDDLWTSIKIGILDIIGGPLATLLNGLTRAGQLRNQLKNIGSDERVNSDIAKLKGSNFKEQVYTAMLNKYSREEQRALDNFKKAQKGGMGSIAIWENRYLAQKAMREDFQARGRAVLNPVSDTKPVPVEIKNPKGDTNDKNEPDLSKVPFDINKAALAATKGIDGGPSDVFTAYKDSLKEQTSVVGELTEAFKTLNSSEGVDKDEQREAERRRKRKDKEKNPYLEFGEDGKSTAKLNNVLGGISGGISQMADGLESMGITIPNEIKSTIGILQGMSAILTGISTTLLAIEALSAADTIIPFAHGGKVPHAASGYFVPGTRRSTDTTPILANAGELVLNESSQDNLALGIRSAESLLNTIDRYQESIMRGSQMGNAASYMPGNNAAASGSPYITGEIIYMGLSAYLESSGRGEIVTSRKRG